MSESNEIEISGPMVSTLAGIVLVVFLVIGVNLYQQKTSDHQKPAPATKVVAMTNGVLEIGVQKTEMTLNKEVEEEALVVRNTNVPVAVFIADKNKIKEQLQKQLAKEQSKNVN